MGDEKWTAAIRPELHPAAQELVAIYQAVPDSTGPGCCPEALAAVLDYVAGWSETAHMRSAALLRGERP